MCSATHVTGLQYYTPHFNSSNTSSSPSPIPCMADGCHAGCRHPLPCEAAPEPQLRHVLPTEHLSTTPPHQPSPRGGVGAWVGVGGVDLVRELEEELTIDLVGSEKSDLCRSDSARGREEKGARGGRVVVNGERHAASKAATATAAASHSHNKATTALEWDRENTVERRQEAKRQRGKRQEANRKQGRRRRASVQGG